MARWNPSSEQISLIIDCEVSHAPIERTAVLLGIKPRTLKTFLKRIEAARVQKAIPAPDGRFGGSPA